MSLVEGTREPISVIRARLRNPPNAVVDGGIDLKRWPKAAREYSPTWRVKAKPAVAFCPPWDPRLVTIPRIQRVVCAHFGKTRAELLERRRTKDIVFVRHLAIYLCKELTSNSLPVIGNQFGGMDHSSVLHALRRIEGMFTVEPLLQQTIEALRCSILGGSNATPVA